MNPKVYILKNRELEVHLTDLGATIVRMITKDKQGEEVDVVLGMERAEDYGTPAYQAGGAYLGAAIGRYGNRIAGGKFVLDGKTYQLAVNNGPNHLHGGMCGFDKRMWTVIEQGETGLVMQYCSKDGEENYPGNLTVDIRFTVEGRALRIDYRAVTDKACFVNLTHHPYFNLNPTAEDIRELELKLYTDRYLKTNDLIPDGQYVSAQQEYDFTRPQKLGKVIDCCGGLDDCYVFDHSGKMTRLAELFSEKTGIRLYVCSDYPGLQVYTGRYLDVQGAKGGKHYGAYAGVALEAQFWPDSPNHPEFPSTLLTPRKEYRQTTLYGFE